MQRLLGQKFPSRNRTRQNGRHQAHCKLLIDPEAEWMRASLGKKAVTPLRAWLLTWELLPRLAHREKPCWPRGWHPTDVQTPGWSTLLLKEVSWILAVLHQGVFVCQKFQSRCGERCLVWSYTLGRLSFLGRALQKSGFYKLPSCSAWVCSQMSVRGIWVLCACLVAQSCLTLCHPMDHSPPDSSVHGDSPGKNTGVGCQALLQSIFATQVLSPGLPNCRRILYHLSHQVSLFASVARL